MYNTSVVIFANNNQVVFENPCVNKSVYFFSSFKTAADSTDRHLQCFQKALLQDYDKEGHESIRI